MNKKGAKERSIVDVMEHHELSRVATLLTEILTKSIITPTQKGQIISYMENKLDQKKSKNKSK